MSIAVSAFVRPSRTHRLLLGACALSHCAIAAAIGMGGAGRYLGAPYLALLPALAAAVLLAAAARPPKTHRIDISGTGDLRVTVQQDVRANGAACRLLPGSVVWPQLMVLRCSQAGGGVHVLVIWRDAVDAAAWRALAVALAAAGRAVQGEAENEH
jgi:toxin CptA